MTQAPKPLLATAGASTSLARQVGFAFGPALATVVWAISDYGAAGLRIAVGLGAAVSVAAIVALAVTRAATPPDETADRSGAGRGGPGAADAPPGTPRPSEQASQ
jgi:hypothetical protein